MCSQDASWPSKRVNILQLWCNFYVHTIPPGSSKFLHGSRIFPPTWVGFVEVRLPGWRRIDWINNVGVALQIFDEEPRPLVPTKVHQIRKIYPRRISDLVCYVITTKYFPPRLAANSLHGGIAPRSVNGTSDAGYCSIPSIQACLAAWQPGRNTTAALSKGDAWDARFRSKEISDLSARPGTGVFESKQL